MQSDQALIETSFLQYKRARTVMVGKTRKSIVVPIRLCKISGSSVRR
jgi:hypothetical protein